MYEYLTLLFPLFFSIAIVTALLLKKFYNLLIEVIKKGMGINYHNDKLNNNSQFASKLPNCQ